ncbi:MAG: TIGR02172 family protein [Bacteroidales bacterium]|nr:TIGR02172 family protein [Bacteroidales bacterium]
MQNTDYPQIDLSQWQQVGEGGNGKTYVNPAAPGQILKVNNARLSSLEAVQHEYDVSKAVEGLGISVPRVYQIVRAGDAYATISELIKDKKSLSRICHDDPERTEEMARLLCRKGKELFSTPCNTEIFPSRKEQVLWAIDHAGFVCKKNRRIIRAFAESIPVKTTCVHGDFQTGNIIQSGDSFYWIDLDRFAYGDPMFDIGHLFQICKVYAPLKQVQEIFHMTLEQFGRFWDAFAKEYTGREDHQEFDCLAGKFACLDVIVRIYFVKPTFVERIFFSLYVRKLVKQYYAEK